MATVRRARDDIQFRLTMAWLILVTGAVQAFRGEFAIAVIACVLALLAYLDLRVIVAPWSREIGQLEELAAEARNARRNEARRYAESRARNLAYSLQRKLGPDPGLHLMWGRADETGDEAVKQLEADVASVRAELSQLREDLAVARDNASWRWRLQQERDHPRVPSTYESDRGAALENRVTDIDKQLSQTKKDSEQARELGRALSNFN